MANFNPIGKIAVGRAFGLGHFMRASLSVLPYVVDRAAVAADVGPGPCFADASGTELIHIGQAVLNLGGTIDYFVENAFNYPTLAEGYKIAALDAYNRMGAR